MTKKVPKKILRIERHFFVNLRKKLFLAAHAAPRRRRRRFFWTGGAPPPPTENDRRAAADTMTSAHRSIQTSPPSLACCPSFCILCVQTSLVFAPRPVVRCSFCIALIGALLHLRYFAPILLPKFFCSTSFQTRAICICLFFLSVH